jgi:hypothetical protein
MQKSRCSEKLGLQIKNDLSLKQIGDGIKGKILEDKNKEKKGLFSKISKFFDNNPK